MQLAGRVRRAAVGALVLAAAALAACGGTAGVGAPTAGPAAPSAPTRGVIERAQPAVSDPAPEAFDPFAVGPLTRASGPGYTLLDPRIVGESPVGMSVWVSPSAHDRGKIAAAVRNAVHNLHALGIAIRWRGYGDPAPSEGVIRISEGSAGCVRGTTVVGMTWPHWQALPSGAKYMTHADTVLCPTLFSRYRNLLTAATVRHELGHTLGLAHTNYRYLGSYQIMNAGVRRGVTHYRAGDRRGIRKLASGSRTLKPVIPPAGRLSASSYQASSAGIVFTGWADLRFYPGSSVTVQLTDNGRTIARTTVRNAHANTFRISTPWLGGTHRYCLRATSSVNTRAAAQLACVTWQS